MSNELKATIKVEAPGVQQTFEKVAAGAAKTEAAFRKIAPGGNAAALALTNVGRVAQDLPFGFLGIANNLNPLLESFAKLRRESGSVGGAFRALAGSLAGAGGLGLALSTFQFFALGGIDALKKMFTATRQVSDEVKTASDAINHSGKEYAKAVELIQELRTNIDLAKQGFIDKADVVKQYNETIGKTTGKVNDLDEAEKALNDNATAYIKYTLLKAAANIALQESAKKAFDAEMQRLRGEKEFLTVGNKIVALSERSKGAAPGGFVPTFDDPRASADSVLAQAGRRRKAAVVKSAQDQADSLEKIAQDFNARAAAIAKEYKFDFFGDGEKDPKTNKALENALKDRERILEEYRYKFQQQKLPFPLLDDVIQKLPKDLALGNKVLSEWLQDFLKIRTDAQTATKDFIPVDSLLDQMKRLQSETSQKIPTIASSLVPMGVIPLKIFIDIEQAKKDVEAAGKALAQQIDQVIESGLETIGEGLGSAISGGGIAALFDGIFSAVGTALQQLGKMLIATAIGLEAIKKAFASLNPVVAAAAGIALIALGGVIKGGVKNIKPFAHGGLVYGPTLGLIGEGSGTSRSNPEVVAPLNMLTDIIKKSFSAILAQQHLPGLNQRSFGAAVAVPVNVNVTGAIHGNDIVLAYRRTTASQIRTHGQS